MLAQLNTPPETRVSDDSTHYHVTSLALKMTGCQVVRADLRITNYHSRQCYQRLEYISKVTMTILESTHHQIPRKGKSICSKGTIRK
ncbi:hypothetical protein Bpfe_029815 [Biomphalaria pfeifferi]|uniref:Uncharacterized protein n=1 Tax=Biomphalaria pfeifferi TaxID=112525 RepID=A0AAD8ATN2_BIOPF|nr:hypothetical protein Bpfe_029815 [Biomphalaria pfeifferi]